MFSPEELEAIALGTRWVVAHADGASLLAGPSAIRGKSWLGNIRQAIRTERKTVIRYRDKARRRTLLHEWRQREQVTADGN